MSLISKVKTAHAFKNDPFGFIADLVITVIANLVIPIPLAGEALKAFKGPILWLLGSFILLGIFMLIVIGTVVFSPVIVSTTFFDRIATLGTPGSLNVSYDGTFAETSIPYQNPLGGTGMTYTSVTAYFHDPAYFLQFGRIHNGIDLVPTDTYYKNSKTYQEVHQVIAFSTINGNARSYIDEFGSQTVEVTNDDSTLQAVFMHFKQILVNDGEIKAGTPLGVMGKTGLATGEHVHYEIRVKSGSNWTPVNALSYIQ